MVGEVVQQLSWARDKVCDNNIAARQVYQDYYDKRATKKDFQVGDRVLVHYPHPPPGINGKLWRQWRGLYVVMKVRDLSTVVLHHLVSNKSITVHKDRVKLFHEFDDPASAETIVTLTIFSAYGKYARAKDLFCSHKSRI